MPVLSKKSSAVVEVPATYNEYEDVPITEFSENAVSFVQLINIMNKPNMNSTNDETDLFKSKVKKIMIKNGASESYIKRYLTDAAVLNAKINNCTAEDLAWVLLH